LKALASYILKITTSQNIKIDHLDPICGNGSRLFQATDLLRGLLVGIFNTRSFPSLQAAYMVETWQKVAVSENELPKRYFLVWA
jgi:hypothetical protein